MDFLQSSDSYIRNQEHTIVQTSVKWTDPYNGILEPTDEHMISEGGNRWDDIKRELLKTRGTSSGITSSGIVYFHTSNQLLILFKAFTCPKQRSFVLQK